MIAQFFKKSSFFVVALLLGASSIQADHVKTKKIQVLVDPSSSDFFFSLTFGAVVTNNPFAPRPAGSSYILNGAIYKEGTIDPDAICYSTTKTPLGVFECVASVLATTSFDGNFPAAGTLDESVIWSFFFTKECFGQANNIIAFGPIETGVFQPNSIGFQGEGMPIVVSRCSAEENDKEHHTNWIRKAKAYFNNFAVCVDGPQILVEIEFEHEIVYHK